MPRLSVDIDMDYLINNSREEMLEHRELINSTIDRYMLSQRYTKNVKTKNPHSLDSCVYDYIGASGNRDNIKIGKQYNTIHYNLQMIIAVGFKVNNERAVQFRKWANQIVKDYTIKGFAMDDERLKSGGTILTEQYFEEQLQGVREIRLSERKFYQKITDIYATAIDYDVNASATKRFFATVQNKLHWAIHGQTASELIFTRADAEKEHMGLTAWKGDRGNCQSSY